MNQNSKQKRKQEKKREINDRNPRTYTLNGEVEEREAKREGGKPN